MGTEEAVFTQIFAQRSFAHIKALSQAYAQVNVNRCVSIMSVDNLLSHQGFYLPHSNMENL